MAEYFDVVDRDDNVVGRATRQECHSRGLLHRSVDVLIFNKKGELFLQKRSMKKDLYKGVWSMSASGHPQPGESYEQAAYRELREELGIKAGLKSISKYMTDFGKDKEIGMLFIGFHDGPFSLNKKEVDDGRFFEIEELKALLKKDRGMFSMGFPLVLNEYLKHGKPL